MSQTYDAVSLGILWDRLISITNEIVLALVRTSFSSIVRESYDLSCVLFDADGRSLAQGTYSVPVFIGTAPQTIRHMLAKFPPETLEPGDVLLTNDSWLGTGHLWDVNVLRPAFRNGRLVGYAFSISHLPDIGGRGFNARNGEIYEEGLQLPVCKLVRAGTLNEELLDLIRLNVRVESQVIGDLMANLSAVELGCRELVAFMDEYDIDDLRPLSQAIIGQSEAAMRRQIAAIPDGTYRNTIRVEAFEEPVTLSCAVTIDGDRLHLDFAGTSGPIPASTNVPLCYTRAMACYAVKCLTLPEIPNNEGSVSPIEIDVPRGCILNVERPAATAARAQVGHFVVPLIFGALADALPDRVPADPGMINTLNFRGQQRDGEPFATLFFSAGGFGAQSGLDGAPASPAPSNISVMSTEVWETTTHTRLVRRALRPDSGGAGAFRGGPGQDIVIRNDTGWPLTLFGLGMRTDFPARGLFGGRPGLPRRYRINGETVHPKGHYVLRPGDLLEIEDAGGGGYGDPSRRDPRLLEEDLTLGLVTPDGARRDFGQSR